MAFKILSQIEIDALSEYERIIYEQAYNEYIERTTFVKRLEQLENVKMPAVSVKKKRIKKIKTPIVPVVKAQGFSADTTEGVNLLNATKKVRSVLGNSLQSPMLKGYKALLPSVAISTPDVVNVEVDTPFLIGKVPSVPLAVPSPTHCDPQNFSVIIPKFPGFTKPDVRDTIIKNYSINALPSVSTKLPKATKLNVDVDFSVFLPNVNIAAPDAQHIQIKSSESVVLKSVPVIKPTVINISIAECELSQCDKFIVNTPTVGYTEQKLCKVQLSSVPIPECQKISDDIKATEIRIPTPNFISTPEVSVKTSQTEITPLTNVLIPTAASQFKIATAAVEEIKPPNVSIPKEVHYTEPKCHVEILRIPTVKIPHINTESELKTIMSKIR